MWGTFSALLTSGDSPHKSRAHDCNFSLHDHTLLRSADFHSRLTVLAATPRTLCTCLWRTSAQHSVVRTCRQHCIFGLVSLLPLYLSHPSQLCKPPLLHRLICIHGCAPRHTQKPLLFSLGLSSLSPLSSLVSVEVVKIDIIDHDKVAKVNLPRRGSSRSLRCVLGRHSLHRT